MRYTKNENYFSETNTKNSYWMGFIAADGCIFYHKNGSKQLVFDIKSNDHILLESFVKDIEYTGVIHKRQHPPYTCKEGNKAGHPAGYTSQGSPSVKLQINNANQLFIDLDRHANIGQRKSDILLPPNFINLDEKIAYITGYFDGDGCLSYRQDKRCWAIHIVGTKELLEWIQETIHPFISSKVGICKHGRAEANTWQLSIHTTQGTQEFLDLMACAIYSPLRRKHDFDVYWIARNNKHLVA